MPVTIVVGGQFGSEGKGKVAHFLASEQNAQIAIRCGGPNSGHTVIDENDEPKIFQILPTASILSEVTCVLCAGMYINVDILLNEIKVSGIHRENLKIDPNAVIISKEMIEAEKNKLSLRNISSTCSGTGEGVRRRIEREKSLQFAKDKNELEPYLCNTKEYLRQELNKNKRVIIEGTQGYGLSILHSEFYPYVTSRDTTAAAFLSEAGLSPLDVDDVVMVIRTFPIRVHGNSGPLPNEINWEILSQELGLEQNICEFTSVTKKVRRVARFDPNIVLEAISATQPTKIVLNHIDYLKDIDEYNVQEIKEICKKFEKFICKEIKFAGISPNKIVKIG